MSRTFYILLILSFGLSKNQIYTHGSAQHLYSCLWRMLCHYLVNFMKVSFQPTPKWHVKNKVNGCFFNQVVSSCLSGRHLHRTS